jgi:uncharacterized protein
VSRRAVRQLAAVHPNLNPEWLHLVYGNMRPWRTTLKRSLIGSLVAYLVLSILGGILLAELQLHPRRSLLTRDSAALEQARLSQRSTLSNVEIRAADGAVLRAWYVRPWNGNRKDVLMLHGVGDNREGVAGFAPLFLDAGYGVLLPDSRAHGESGGKMATYGLLESDDIHRWVSWLYARQSSTCVYGFGESMGAALVLESLSSEKRFCAVIAESPFSSFRTVGYERAALYLGFKPWFGRTVGRLPVEAGLMYAWLRYGLNFAGDNPIDAVGGSATPILLIHGLDDVNILPRHSELMAEKFPSHVELWEVPGAAHCGASAAEPDEFDRRVLKWFGAY